MNVTSEILQKIKCSICECYLSQTPIFGKENGETFCGRCTPDEQETRKVFRMLVFENLLPVFSFPCMYQKDGCRETIPYMKLRTHEEFCKYKKYKCPVVPSGICDWVDSPQKLYEHCNSKHSHRILKHPCVLKHDITKDCSEFYVTYLSGYLFLINTKVCLTAQKIYHSVQYIGDTSDLTELKFKLDIRKNNEIVIKKGVIVQLGNKESSPVVCGINGFTDTTFTIHILIQSKNGIKCEICGENDKEYFGKYCSECAEKRRPCFNEHKGCNYIDISIKTEQHEKLFCLYQNWCFICGKKLVNNYPISSNHYKITHENRTYKANEYWEINFDNILSENNDFNFIIDTLELDNCFGVIKKKDVSNIEINLSATKLTEEIRKHICVIKIKAKNNGRKLKLTVPFVVKSNEDWSISLPISCVTDGLAANLNETLISFDIRKIYK